MYLAGKHELQSLESRARDEFKLWLLYLRLFTTRFQQTGAYRCPDSNHKRSYAHDKHDGKNNHLYMVVFIVGLDVIIVDLRVLRNNQRDANAVEKDDYSTKHGGCNRETHENAGLKKKIYL